MIVNSSINSENLLLHIAKFDCCTTYQIYPFYSPKFVFCILVNTDAHPTYNALFITCFANQTGQCVLKSSAIRVHCLHTPYSYIISAPHRLI